MNPLFIILGVIILLIVMIIGIYNRLIALRQTCNQAWSDIEVQLKQRQDLIPGLVDVVKGYAKHEKETLQAVIDARNSAISAKSMGDTVQAEGLLSQAMGKLFALAEAYPDLKANQNFLQLQDELSDVENKIAAARRFFNNSVQEYNTGIEQFPANMIAGSFSFEKRDFYESLEGREALQTAPDVSF
ncbi:MAG: hypothetical protein COA43_03910 [Robiginitomaculum sp.]|nr:MAG: hypothetical protein COA43_03910 [Robiginitomaculum sp.]